jgi:phosphoribosyl 1,2-cyclic phosphodiesterase
MRKSLASAGSRRASLDPSAIFSWMHLQVISSGSEGNSTLIRAGETNLIVDSGLTLAEMEIRLQAVGLPAAEIAHVVVTHGHLDHARSAGALARKARAMLHCPENIMNHPSARRAKRLSRISVGARFEVRAERADNAVELLTVALSHDCDPIVVFWIEHEGRTAAILTDIGRPSDEVARSLHGAHVLVLEFNYDPEMMRAGPYSPELQKRITGSRGHLSNQQAAEMLEALASPNLHTLVLAHLSQKNNTPELALAAAHGALERVGMRSKVRVLIGSQREPLESLPV